MIKRIALVLIIICSADIVCASLDQALFNEASINDFDKDQTHWKRKKRDYSEIKEQHARSKIFKSQQPQ